MKKQEKAEITKKKILNNAIKLFGENSYEGTSVKEIAITSKVSQGLLYNYFESKEHLLIEIFEFAKEEIQLTFKTNDNTNDKTNFLSLEKYFENIVEATSKNQNLWRIIHTVKFNKALTKILKTQIKDFNTFILNLLQDLIIKTNPNCTQEELKLYFAAIDGLVAHSLIIKNYDLKSEFQELITIIRGKNVQQTSK